MKPTRKLCSNVWKALLLFSAFFYVDCSYAVDVHILDNNNSYDEINESDNVGAGDTIFIYPARTDRITFRNLIGSASNYIVIINKNGQVNIDDDSNANIGIYGCKFIKITGTGYNHPALKHGIVLSNSLSNGVDNGLPGLDIKNYTSDITVEFLEITGSGFTGISAKTDNPTAGFVMRNLIIHDCKIHHLRGGEGIYVGYNGWKGDGTQHDIEHVRIYNIETDYTYREAIQIGACPNGDAKVYNNKIRNFGRGWYNNQVANNGNQDQNNGVQLGQGFSGEVYNNSIIGGEGKGMNIVGVHGAKVYNNVIANPELWGIYVGNGHGVIANKPIYFYHNTFVNTGLHAMKYDPNAGGAGEEAPGYFYNNIVVNEAGVLTDLKPYFTEQGTIDRKISQIGDLKFKNAANNEYDLLENSIAINQGVSLSSLGTSLSFDLEGGNGTEPPLPPNRTDGKNDVGAFEYGGFICYPTAVINPQAATITLPVDSVVLSGSSSYTSCSGPIGYTWSHINGSPLPTLTPDAENGDTVTVSDLSTLDSIEIHDIKLVVKNINGNGSEGFAIAKITVKYPAPIVSAESDKTITTSSTTLTGTASDPASGALSYLWTSSNSNYTATGANTSTISLSNLSCGQYRFTLTVTNSRGMKRSDEVVLTVSPSVCPNRFPVAKITDHATVLTYPPTNSISLSGSQSSDADGNIASYSWEKLSSPAATLSGESTASLSVSNMAWGTHEFRLVVTDNLGAKDTAITTVVVKSSPPTADAGSDVTLTYPTNSVRLIGTATGNVTSYLWNRENGPNDPVSSRLDNDTIFLSNLSIGQYTYSFTVTSEDGQVASDLMVITVSEQDFNTVLYRVNCGGSLISGSPTDWLKDKQGSTERTDYLDPSSADFTTGSETWTPNANKSNNTGAPNNLFGPHRYQPSGSQYNPVKFSFPVTTGLYKVNLYFAVKEAWEGDAVGERVFHVKIEDQYALKNFDIFADSRLNAVKKEFTVKVTDGNLTIDLERYIGNPQINGIEIISLSQNLPPEAFAGNDQSIELPINSTSLSGSGVDEDGVISSYGWKKISGPTTYTASDTMQPTLYLSNLVAGTYQFRLRVTDNNNAIAMDTVQVIVSSAPVATGLIYRVNCGGFAVTDSDMNWAADKQTEKSEYLSPLSSNYTTGTETWNAIDGTNATGAPNKIFGTLRHDLSSTNPITYEFPVNNGPYTLTLFFKVNTAASTVDQVGDRVFHVLAEGDSILTNFDIRAVAGVNAYSATFTVTVQDGGLTLDLARKTGNPQINGIQVSGSATPPSYTAKYRVNCGGAVISGTPVSWEKDQQGSGNTSAYLVAGSADAVTGSSTWTGTNTTGAPDNIFGNHRYQPTGSQYNPVKYSFPVSNGIVQVNLYFAVKNGFEGDAVGERVFSVNIEGGGYEMDGFDMFAEAGLSAIKKSFEVEVADGKLDIELIREIGNPQINGIEILTAESLPPSTNQAPSANAGLDKIITYPETTTILNGSGFDSDGSIASYSWTKQSGPTVSMANSSSPNLSLSALQKGKYVFRLTITDDKSATGYDDVVVYVLEPLYRVNCGGIAIAASPVNWAEDRQGGTESAYLDGSSYTLTTGSLSWTGTNTTGAPNNLFGGNRYDVPGGTNMKYNFPVQNGIVVVKLYFAVKKESTVDDIGERIFDVKAEGNTEIQGLDVRKKAGHSAYAEVFDLVVTDNTLNLEFVPVAGSPQINAIEILGSGTSGSALKVANTSEDTYEEDTETPLLMIYPNPSAGKVELEFISPEDDVIELDIYNMNGVRVANVFKGAVTKNHKMIYSMRGEGLGSGIYICRLVTNKGVVFKRMVIQ